MSSQRRRRHLSIRLTESEYDALMRQPGNSVSEKIRALLHADALARAIADNTARAIESGAVMKKIARVAERLSELDDGLNERVSRATLRAIDYRASRNKGKNAQH